MLRVECIRDTAVLESLKPDWDRLAHGSVMRGFSWQAAWWDAYRDSCKLHVLVAYRDDRICGLLPLSETYSAWTGRTLVFIGSGKVCSDDLGILVDEIERDEVADAFATFLVESKNCCRWDHLNLDGIRESDLGMLRFGRMLKLLNGAEIEYKASPNCWVASLEGGEEAYRKRLSKRARKILSEAFEEVESGRSQFEVAQTLPQAHAFAKEIERMHQSRWKERGIQGCFTEHGFTDFLQHAIERLWHDPVEGVQQRILISLLRIDGNCAAGSICIRDRESMMVYLTGMDPDFSEQRPGWQVNACSIHHAIQTGCLRYDLLRGDEDYKERLGCEPVVQQRWLIPSSRLVSQVRHAAYKTAVQMRSWWRPPTPA
jgi:CelD/BcsL family acetyltransferase involved in cellulose biosynthesis